MRMQYLVNVIMTYAVRFLMFVILTRNIVVILLIIQKNILIFVVLSYYFDSVFRPVYEVKPSLKGDDNS